jgi:hypothetical protein
MTSGAARSARMLWLRADFHRYWGTTRGCAAQEFDDAFLEEIEKSPGKLAVDIALRNEPLLNADQVYTRLSKLFRDADDRCYSELFYLRPEKARDEVLNNPLSRR